MAKTPKVKKETNATRLETLKKHGFIEKSVKTFNKSVKTAWGHFKTAFPSGRVYPNAQLLKGSKATLKAASSVNMLVIGNRIVYPGGNTKVSVRETKDKVIFYQRKPSGHRDIIVLGKDGNHLQAGLNYAKTFKNRAGKKHSFGTLKTHDVVTKNGLVHRGFIRDVAMTYENPIDAMLDHRYSIGNIALDPGDYLDDVPGFLQAVDKTNGVAALIITEY